MYCCNIPQSILFWNKQALLSRKQKGQWTKKCPSVYTQLLSFHLITMQYTQPARKHCIRKRNKLLVKSLLAASVISHDTRFVMDFLIFVREVIWYVFIWLWLAPRGAGGYCRGCSCANITWFCLQQSLYTNPSWYCFHSWQTSGSNCSPTTLYPTVYVCTYMHLYMCVCVCVKSHVILVTTRNTSGKTIKINRK